LVSRPEEIERARLRMASVVRLDRVIKLGRRVLAGQDPEGMREKYGLTAGELHEARLIARAEERGLLAGEHVMTMEEARIAAGIE
jgi:hypothetical protein